MAEINNFDRDSAQSVERYVDSATARYLVSIGRYRILKGDEIIRLARVSKGNGAEADYARETLVKHNLRLVVSIAKRYQNRGVELIDLISEGNIGLVHAVRKFDPEKGFQLSTYAYFWIRQAILRAINNKSRFIRLPVHICNKLAKIRAIEEQLRRTLTDQEIASLVDWPIETVVSLRQIKKTVSYNVKMGESDSEVIDLLPTTSENNCYQGEISSLLRSALHALSPIEAKVVELRYGVGLVGLNEPMSHDKIAKQLNLKRSRVGRIEREALMKLRKHPSLQGLI
jgi:RNA polymerase sigma factor (sigma-70 family)